MRYTITGVKNEHPYCETEETTVQYTHIEEAHVLEKIEEAFENKETMWIVISKEKSNDLSRLV